ncbi:lipocalin family protein [Porticoccus sp.]
MKQSLRIFSLLWVMVCLGGCLGMPEGVEPVRHFDGDAYLGTWYEIARLDHSFERGLSRVSAEYSRRDDGGIRVINRGYDETRDEWKSAEGRAYFVRGPEEGHLKVSFFGPFFSSYVVFELDQGHYQYAFISGYNRKYLWLLARTPEVEPALIDRFRQSAERLGFDTRQLIFPVQKTELSMPLTP